jgi:hypothetical protein
MARAEEPQTESDIRKAPAWRRRLIRVVLALLVVPFALLGLVYGLFLFPAVQHWTAVRASAWAADRSGTEVSMEQVKLQLFRRFVFGQVYIEDFNGDTLLAAEELVVRMEGFHPLKRELLVRHVKARGLHFTMRREFGEQQFSLNEFLARLGGAEPAAKSGDTLVEISTGPEPDLVSESEAQEKSGKPWTIALGDLELQQSRFRFLDHNARTYMHINIPSLLVMMKRTDPSARILHARQIELRDLEVDFFKQDTLRGPSFRTPPDTPRLDTKGWIYSADHVVLRNASFRYNDERKAPGPGMDYAHLDVQGIELQADDARFATDSISAAIRRMQASDHCGFVLSQLQGAFSLTPSRAQLLGMKLETPHSRLGDSLSMDYGTFRNFAQFIDRVRMDARLSDSHLDARDLQYFAPALHAVQGPIAISGHVYGRVRDLNGRNLLLGFGRDSRLEGDFDVVGLPDAAESFIEFNLAELATSAQDLKQLLPGLNLPASLDNLGRLRAQGEFIGFPRDFVAFGELQTAIGQVNSDLNLKVDPQKNSVAYSGNLDLRDFDLGAWTGRSDLLGTITVESSVQGSGLSSGFGLENLDALLQARVASLVLNEYDYRDLTFDGRMQEGFFEGSLESFDPHFDQTFEGTIDLRDSLPVFDFYSSVRNIDLDVLGFYPHALNLKAQLRLKLSGNSIDNVIGQGGIYGLYMEDDDRIYVMDSLRLDAQESGDQRILSLNSELFDARFEGDFTLSRFVDAIRGLAHYYFPRAGLPYALDNPVQDMHFAVNIRDSRDFLRLLNPELGTLLDVSVSGSINSLNNSFALRARIPEFILGSVRVETWLLDLQTSQNSLQLFSRAETIALSDSLATPVVELNAGFRSDSLYFKTLVGRDTDPDRLNLSGVITGEPGAFRMSLLPSEIYARDNRWDISPNNSILYEYKNKKLLLTDFTLSSGQQHIALSSLDKPGYESWIDADLRRVNLGPLLTAFKVNPMKLEGELSGIFSASNVLTELGFAANLQLNDMMIDQLPMGSLALNTSMQKPENRLNFLLNLSGASQVAARGMLDFSEGGELDASFRINAFPLEPLSVYLSGLFDQMSGSLSGDFELGGSFQQPEIRGQAAIQDGRMRLIYTNARYEIPQLDLVWQPGRLVLQPATLLDEEGNSGLLSGAVSYTRLDNWRFENLNIRTEKMRFMGNNRMTNPELYGTAYGKGSVNIQGPLDDIAITILAATLKGTSITVPITYGPSLSTGNFISFRQPDAGNGRPKEREKKPGRVRFLFYLDVDEQAEVALELLGDRLSARGQGNLNLELSTLGDFTMNGVYTVTQGSYNFSLQEMVSKDFRIAGQSRIAFNGDPYQAQLEVDAVYTARTSEWDLVSEYTAQMSAQELERARQLQNVDVYLKLRGSLEAPDVSFDIQVPGGQSGGTSVFERRLQEIKADENELNKQVFGLLVMNRFIPDQSGITPLLSGASNSVSEFISRQLSAYVTDWVSEFLITDVDIDISYRNYQRSEAELTQQELQIELSKRFFDDRIYVNVGGNIGLNQTTAPDDFSGRTNTLVGDFEVEYAITQDGRFRVKAFQRPTYDVISGRNIAQTGIGLYYSQEFDSLSDLFRRDEGSSRGAEREGRKPDDAVLPEE